MNLWVSAVQVLLIFNVSARLSIFIANSVVLQASINVENTGVHGKSKMRRAVIANESVETTPRPQSSTKAVPKSREAKKAINGALQVPPPSLPPSNLHLHLHAADFFRLVRSVIFCSRTFLTTRSSSTQ